jgi:hypothetical protein
MRLHPVDDLLQVLVSLHVELASVLLDLQSLGVKAHRGRLEIFHAQRKLGERLWADAENHMSLSTRY